MAQKTELEHYLKETVDKVKAERKKQSNKSKNKLLTKTPASLGMLNSGLD